MARRRKRRNPAGARAYSPGRKSPKRVAAGRKAARTRARKKAARRAAARRSVRRRRGVRTYVRKRAVRSWRRLRGKRRRLTVKRTRRGLTRSPYSRLGFRRGRRVRVNPRRRFSLRGLLGRWRIQRALPLLGGFAGAVSLKPVARNFLITYVPANFREIFDRGFGVITIFAGGFISSRSRRRMVKDVGLGMVMGGVYDLIASNFANLPFIPKVIPGALPGAGVAPAADTVSSSIGRGDFSVVGASNISMDMEPEIVGCDADLDDLI